VTEIETDFLKKYLEKVFEGNESF